MINGMSVKKLFLSGSLILCSAALLLFVLIQMQPTCAEKTSLSLHEKMVQRYGAELVERYCQTHGAITFQSANEIEDLFPEEVFNRFKNHARELAQDFQGKKRRQKLLCIFQNIEKVNGTREKARLYYNLCKILRMTRDISSLQSQKKIDKQLDLLHQAIRVMWISSKGALDKYSRIGNPNGLSLLIQKNSVNWGVLKCRDEWSEIAVWDMSLVLDCDQAIAPSMPIYSHQKNFVFQPFRKAKFFKGLFLFPKKIDRRVHKIAEWDFWKPNLFLFLIGHRDLTCCNIGVSKNRTLFICDNEGAFSAEEQRIFENQGKDFTLQLPTMNLMMDWPQARTPMSCQVAKNVQTLASTWSRKKEDLFLYIDHPFNDYLMTADQRRTFENRFEKILDRQWIPKETTFQGFILSVYPHLYDGARELVDLASPVIGARVSPMSALLFISMCRGWWDRLTEEDNENFLRCLEKYSADR